MEGWQEESFFLRVRKGDVVLVDIVSGRIGMTGKAYNLITGYYLFCSDTSSPHVLKTGGRLFDAVF